MQKVAFSKYQGTGNDFVIIDQTKSKFIDHANQKLISYLCHRRFGIGADGLILIEKDDQTDFRMVYFNSDGSESTMCGNGGRCAAAFAFQKGILNHSEDIVFEAIDGLHRAEIDQKGKVKLKMNDVLEVDVADNEYILNTGSPHYVTFVEDLDDIDVYENGRAIRYSDRFREDGINVNFVEKEEEGILVGTYERGVENETLSCGTGVVAACLSFYIRERQNGKEMDKMVKVRTKGGRLSVRFAYDAGVFSDIWLEGPAQLVFDGIFEI